MILPKAISIKKMAQMEITVTAVYIENNNMYKVFTIIQ